jgi:hypothetical protein
VAIAASLRTLLAGAVDYAGLYPPASVDMPTAVRNYTEYRRSQDAWMLGRLVVPIGGLAAFEEAWSRVDEGSRAGWSLSAVLGSDAPSDIARAHAFNDTHHGQVQIDSVEARLGTPDAIKRAAAAADQRLMLFAEVPATGDVESMLAAVAESGASAKIRTGGTTPDAFPPAADIARFIHTCIEKRVPFKATAGLHHPLRAEYRLTYQPDAPCGTMFGYVNVFLAAAYAGAGVGEAELADLLEETDPRAFVADDRRISWRSHELTLDQIRDSRHRLQSFGSCSFREPVDELATLGIGS